MIEIRVEFFVSETAAVQINTDFFTREQSALQINVFRFSGQKNVRIYTFFEKRYSNVPIEVYFRRKGIKITVTRKGRSFLPIRALFFGSPHLPSSFVQYLRELGVTVS